MMHTFLLVLIDYLREVVEVVLIGFVIAGVLDAVINKQAVVRYLGGNIVTSNVSTLGPITRFMGKQTAMLYGASVVILAAVLGFTLNLAVA